LHTDETNYICTTHGFATQAGIDAARLDAYVGLADLVVGPSLKCATRLHRMDVGDMGSGEPAPRADVGFDHFLSSRMHS
jgi:hypothetical protein